MCGLRSGRTWPGTGMAGAGNDGNASSACVAGIASKAGRAVVRFGPSPLRQAQGRLFGWLGAGSWTDYRAALRQAQDRLTTSRGSLGMLMPGRRGKVGCCWLGVGTGGGSHPHPSLLLKGEGWDEGGAASGRGGSTRCFEDFAPAHHERFHGWRRPEDGRVTDPTLRRMGMGTRTEG